MCYFKFLCLKCTNTIFFQLSCSRWLLSEVCISLNKLKIPACFLEALANIFTVLYSTLCLALLKCFPCLSQPSQSADSSFDRRSSSEPPAARDASKHILHLFCPYWPFRFILRGDTLFRLNERRVLAVMYY